MRFIKDLIHWFIHGKFNSKAGKAQDSKDAHVGHNESEKNSQGSMPNPAELSNGIRNSLSPKQFLSDLKSISPPSRAYTKAYLEIIREIKNIRHRHVNQK